MTAAAANDSTNSGIEERTLTDAAAAATNGAPRNGSGSHSSGQYNGNGSGYGSGRPQYSNASNFERGGYNRENQADRPKPGAMEVHVDHNIEKAMRVLKRKLIKEGLFKELKSRRYYEKPSERRKRKEKESKKKVRKEEARAKKNPMLLA